MTYLTTGVGNRCTPCAIVVITLDLQGEADHHVTEMVKYWVPRHVTQSHPDIQVMPAGEIGTLETGYGLMLVAARRAPHRMEIAVQLTNEGVKLKSGLSRSHIHWWSATNLEESDEGRVPRKIVSDIARAAGPRPVPPRNPCGAMENKEQERLLHNTTDTRQRGQ